MADTPLILCADIGGTNTRLALFDGARLRAGSARSYANASVDHLDAHLLHYITETGAQPDMVALALAGPVMGDAGELTNLNWHITTQGASAISGGARAVLLNDLQAQGHALPHVPPAQMHSVHDAAAPPLGTQVVIGLGTGMNIAVVHPRAGGAAFVPAAEAGHVTFAPFDPELRALGDFLKTRLGHVAAEDVLSGRGLASVHAFVSGRELAPADVMTACAQGDEQARRSVALVAHALGGFAGDMALVHMALGGVALVGGVARALTPYLSAETFGAGYLDKGRFSHIPRAIPVRVVHDDYAALTGAAMYALQTG